MMAKTLLFIAQALFIQCITSQCIGTAYNTYADGLSWGMANGLAWDGALGPYGPYSATPFAAPWTAAPWAAAPCATAEWATGYAPATLAASNGGGFAVNSASPIAATGVALTSENAYEGGLAVTGALPFLGAVAMEGPLPTLGAGTVTYGCGNGNVAILNEDMGLAGYTAFAGPYGPYGPAEFGYGYGAPLAYETAIAGGPAYAGAYGYRGCGYGPVY